MIKENGLKAWIPAKNIEPRKPEGIWSQENIPTHTEKYTKQVMRIQFMSILADYTMDTME